MKKEKARPDLVLLAILAAGALLISWGLGTRDLWQDEAETALLAKSILRTGLPVGFDGVNLISSEAGRDLGRGYLWQWSPWLQFYLAAGSMSVLGVNTLAARLPFAMLGFFCLPMTYFLARRLFGSQRIARTSVLLLALCVPFLLHVRQARWYAAAYLFILLLFREALELERGKARYVLAAVLLFYTNYFVAIGVLAALLFASPLLDRGLPKRLFVADLWVLPFCLPGVFLFDVLGKSGGFDPARTAVQLWTYAGFFLTFLLPLPLLFWVWKDRRSRFLLAFCGLLIAYFSLAPWKVFRYVSVLAPLSALMAAPVVDAAWSRRGWVGGLLLAALTLTNVLHMLPLELFRSSGTAVADAFASAGYLRSPLLGYLYETAHPFETCDHVVAALLKKEAGPKDVVIATYGDLPLQFYTGLRVLGGFQGQVLPSDPDWIILHPFVMDRRPGRDVDVARFILSRVDLKRYRKIDLPCVDAILGTCTEPAAHLFKLPDSGASVALYRKI